MVVMVGYHLYCKLCSLLKYFATQHIDMRLVGEITFLSMD